MVRATVILSVVAAFVAAVSAAPKGSLVDLDGGDYIGTGNINAQNALTHVVNADDLQAHDLVQNVDVLGEEDSMMARPMSSGGSGSGRRINRVDAGGRGSIGASAGGSGCGGGCGHDDHGLLNHILKREEAAPAKAMGKNKMTMRRKVARKD